MPFINIFKRRLANIQNGLSGSINRSLNKNGPNRTFKPQHKNAKVQKPYPPTPYNQGPPEDMPPEQENIFLSTVIIICVGILCFLLIYRLEARGTTKIYTNEGKMINNWMYECQQAKETCFFVYPRKALYNKENTKDQGKLQAFHERMAERMRLPGESIVVKNKKMYILFKHKFGDPETFHSFVSELMLKSDLHGYEARSWEPELIESPTNINYDFGGPICTQKSDGQKSCSASQPPNRKARRKSSGSILESLTGQNEKKTRKGEFKGTSNRLTMLESYRKVSFMPDEEVFNYMRIRGQEVQDIPYLWRYDKLYCYDPFKIKDYSKLNKQDYWPKCGKKKLRYPDQKAKKKRPIFKLS